MVTRIGGFRRKTRDKLSKGFRSKGKLSLTNYFQTFQNGEKVLLLAEPAVQKGMYFPRYHGKDGTVKSRKGKCYEIMIMDGKKEKSIIIHPVHLKRKAR